MDPPAPLLALLRDETGRPVPAEVTALADAARARHPETALAVLFYGSGLRERSLDGKLADLYLLVERYAPAEAGGRLLARLNRLLPPNVHYLALPGPLPRIHAKYAVVALDQLERLVGPGTDNPYFWARFAQPVRIVWARDPAVQTRILALLATAAATMVRSARPLVPEISDSRGFWRRAFALTYRTELRAERTGRGDAIYAADAERYDRILALADTATSESPAAAGRHWRRRALIGKLLSVARLVKAAFTFQDGADYLAWKIERHAGIRIQLTPWQRRHPILSAPKLLWRLWRAGAVR